VPDLKQSTTATVRVGPVVDTAGAVVTSATLTIRLSKAGGAHVNRNDATAITHDSNGYYVVTLDTTDTNTIGRLDVAVTGSGFLPFKDAVFDVRHANVFDVLNGSVAPSTLSVSAFEARTLPAADYFDPATDQVTPADGSITAAKIASNAITDAKIAADAITAAKIATGALTSAKFASGAITSTVLASNAIGASQIASNAITDAKIASDAITAAKIATGALTAAKFAAGAFDAVWSVATRLLTAGTNIVLAKGTGITGLNDPTAADIAQTVLRRDAASDDGNAAEHSLYTVIQSVKNFSTTATPGSLVIYRTNGTTVHTTIPLDTDATAEAIVSAGISP
jgi:hypothetical protein